MNPNPPIVCHKAPKFSTTGIWLGQNPLDYSFPLLTLQLALVFTTIRIIYFLIKPLKQPRVVAEILGGIILGPSVLGRSAAFTNTVFPARGTQVLDTVAMFGLMYYIFLIGVKMDPTLMKKSGRKEILIGMVSSFLPLIVVSAISFPLRPFLPKDLQNVVLLIFLASLLSVTSFAVLVPILYELQLLNSEIGRLAMSSSILSDICGWMFMATFIVLQASSVSAVEAIWALLSLIAIVLFIVLVIRPASLWIIRQTPEGKPVEEIYILMILVLVCVIGFLSDMIGANSFNGALVLGLALPEGPPLGSTIVERLDCIISGLLLPLYYCMSGLKTDVSTIQNLGTWSFLQLLVVLGCLGKLLGTLLPSLYFKIPFREALSLSLLMNAKGVVELITFNFWKDIKLLDDQAFTILVLSTVIITAIVTPLMRILYEPLREYAVYGRRTMINSNPETDTGILVCIHNQSNVPSLIRILEASHPTSQSPISVYALHLVQLVGRSTPLIITHNLSAAPPTTRGSNQSERIINAFRIYQERHEEGASVHPFTAIAPCATMHNDALTLALQKEVSFMIIPFHKQPLVDGGMEHNSNIQAMNRNILGNAPCSVGILIDRRVEVNLCPQSDQVSYNIGILFFGGDDDREVLACAARMATNPSVYLTIMRFFPPDSMKDRSRDRRLDDEIVTNFKSVNMRNDRVVFRESVVKDIEQIVGAIRSISSENYHLLMVGMRHERSPLLSADITDWSECPELGMIGDLLASQDLNSTTSVLLVRQAHVRANPNLNHVRRADIIESYGGQNSLHREQGEESSVRSSIPGSSVRSRASTLDLV